MTAWLSRPYLDVYQYRGIIYNNYLSVNVSYVYHESEYFIDLYQYLQDITADNDDSKYTKMTNEK